MLTYSTKVDARGRLTIPKPVRVALGLQAGGRLVWRQLDDRTFELLNAARIDPRSGSAPSSIEAAAEAPGVNAETTDSGDDFGKKLTGMRGSIDPDFDLGI
jgi:AbrB family looped-hinge helix DNA binding protein